MKTGCGLSDAHPCSFLSVKLTTKIRRAGVGVVSCITNRSRQKKQPPVKRISFTTAKGAIFSFICHSLLLNLLVHFCQFFSIFPLPRQLWYQVLLIICGGGGGGGGGGHRALSHSLLAWVCAGMPSASPRPALLQCVKAGSLQSKANGPPWI